jgi:hypothetical protein
VIDAAQSYVARGWCVFPAPIGEKKSLMSAKNDRLGRKWGATCEPDDVVNYWNKWPNANVAVVTGPQSGIWVLDIDTPEGHARDGFASLAALVAEHGPLPETLTAESPSGSRHLYFNWPSAGGIRNTTNVPGPGLDVRAEGGMVIAPPSVKPDGGRYIWVNASPVADAPQWLLDLVTPDAPQMPAPRRATPPALGEVEELLTYIDPNAGGYKHWQTILSAIHDAFGGSDDGMHLADKWSERGANHNPGEVQDKWPTFTSGKGGGSGMGTIGYHAKQAGADVAAIGARHRLLNMPGPSHVPAGMMPTAPVQGMPSAPVQGAGMPSAPRAASVVDLICAKIQENPHESVHTVAEEVARLKPVDRETVFDYCKDQGVKIKMQIAVKEAVADSRKAAMELRGLIADKNGGPVPNMTNIKRVLCSEEGWRGTFAKSLFDDAVWVRLPDTRQMTDDDILKVTEIMQSDLFPSIGIETVRHGVQAAAAGNTFHPVREYLESLQWDGVGRAAALFTTYFPCASEDPQYLRAVGEKFLIGAVARVMQPGCKVDTMPVIAGSQGQKKSSGLAALVGDQWYGNDMPDMNANTDKDAKQWLRGKWVAEMGELSAVRGAMVEHVKNFLSTTSDSYRKSYGHVTQTYPRQTVFAGTVNDSEYLSDETGNRRFWPLQMIEGAFVDVAGLERDRGLLWAEALHMYRSGTAWWFDEGESATLSAQQAAARSVDIDETRVVEWLRGQEGPVTAGGVAATLFADAPGNKSLSMRVARYLQGAGWRPVRRVSGTKQWDRGRGAEPYVSPSCGGNVMPMTPRR